MSRTLDLMDKRLDGETITVLNEEGEEIEKELPAEKPSPAFLAACINLLKHNSITCAVEESKGLSSVQKSLNERRKNRPAPLAEIEHLDDHRESG